VAWALGFGDLGILVTAQSGLWTGLLLTCRFVSRRYGTGSIRRDYRLVMRWRDLGTGFVISWIARIVAVVIILPFVLLDDRFRNRTDIFTGLEPDAATIATIAVIAVVGAPLIEELFFRGLLQRALENVVPIPAAIGGQAVLFGVAHVSVHGGWANIPTTLGIGACGAVFGFAAWRWRRLGPSIAAHGFFNALAVAALLLTR
jgi:uncharacterized protein